MDGWVGGRVDEMLKQKMGRGSIVMLISIRYSEQDVRMGYCPYLDYHVVYQSW